MLVPAFSLAAATSALILTPHDASELSNITCLHNNFHGIYGNPPQNMYITDMASIMACDFSGLQEIHNTVVVPIAPSSERQLVWIEQEAIENDILQHGGSFDNQVNAILALARRDSEMQHKMSAQMPYAFEDFSIYSTPTSTLLSLPIDMATRLSEYLTPYTRIRPVPASPESLIPVPKDAVERVRDILSELVYDSKVARVVESLDITQMTEDITYLSGEAETSEIVSRHSFSKGSRIASQYIKETIESTGADCELRDFLLGFAPNVICTYPHASNSNSTVIISAHYDSRGSFGSTRAPGADDDGSGTTAILAIARAISRERVSFNNRVQLVTFAGEEQGLLGSKAYAKQLRDEDADIIIMIQADMLGYHKPGEPVQLGLPATIGTPEVSQLVSNLSAFYSPELTVGITAACCSDHQSFHMQGYPATQVFERNGPIADPMYHNSGDLSRREGFDIAQVRSIAKVQFAAILHAAGFYIGA